MYSEVLGNRLSKGNVDSLWLKSFWNRDRHREVVIGFNGKAQFPNVSAKSMTFCLLVLFQPT